MGMDLITHGFTAEDEKCNEAGMRVALDTITDEWIEDNADALDPSGGFEPEDMRGMIETGVEDYLLHIKGDHRSGNFYTIPGSTHKFYIAGGGSWGDDPYDDWSALGVFLSVCELVPELAQASGYFGYGIQP